MLESAWLGMKMIPAAQRTIPVAKDRRATKCLKKKIFAIILLIIPNALQWSCRRTESVAYLDTMTMEGIYMSPKPMPVITL